MELKFTINAIPRTKKNSQQIRYRNGKPFITRSAAYSEYERECMWLISGANRAHINTPVNVKAIFYMPTRRKVDISNLISALHDVLVAAGVLADDSSSVVVGVDGSRVRYDKSNPRTEVYIYSLEGEDG